MADGSHATFSGYPKTCTACGRPVRITGPEPLWFETTPPQSRRSYHVRCYLSAPRTTLASPAPKGDCALAGAANQPGPQAGTAAAPRLYSPTSARSPRNGGDMLETPEPQPEPEPDDGNGDDE